MAETTTAAGGARSGRAVALVGSFLFLGLGVAFLVPFFAMPVARIVAARGWSETTCTILESAVRSTGDDTYAVEVRYTYRSGSDERIGTRYKFMGGSSSGRAGKLEIVAGLPPGSRVRCYVDPLHPDEAVIDRGPTGDLAFGLIPLAFVLMGLLAVRGALRRRPPTAAELARVAAALPPDAAAASPLPRTLRRTSSPAARFVGMLIVSLFWNGIVAIFVVGVVSEWQRGHAPVVMSLFLLPFAGVGIFLVPRTGKELLRIWNPRAQLVLTPGTLVLGQPASIEWTVEGAAERINTLTITLEGHEEATYVRGTDRRTDKAVFARIPVGHGGAGAQIRRGAARFEVPAGAMHTFVSSNNKVLWVIRLHGQIDRWPDLDEEFPVTVLPSRRQREDLA